MMMRGLGVDIVEITRMRAALARQPGLAARLFTPGERDYCQGHADPPPHYAARFAAKEAVAKAVGRHLRWQEVEVVTEPSGRPTLSFTGESAAVTRGASFLVSLSHSREHAVAAVVMLGPPPGLPEDEARTVIV